jgi:hypothetical protein
MGLMEDELWVERWLDSTYEQEWLDHLWLNEDPDLGISDDNWACGTLDVET